jgi:Domain of Unknown Function (DUF928)
MKQLHHLSLYAATLTILLFVGTITPVTLGLSIPKVQIAQSAADYQNAMKSGYDAAAKQDFKAASENFKRALKLRPSDRNAQVAIKNINALRNEEQGFHVTPSGVGAPSVRERGATRQQNCLEGRKLVAIIPENQLGLTSLARPTLLFYIPTTSAKSLQIKFENDRTGTTFYEKKLTTPTKPGLAKFDFGELKDTPPLELEKTYRWTLTLHCDPQDTSADVNVSGTIRRIELDPILVRTLETASLRDRANLYAVNRLWYDAVKALAEARLASPRDTQLGADWAELLKSIGLNAEFSPGIP